MTTSPGPAVDLSICATEPIHIPGLIQPHGCLILVEASSGHVLQASANAVELLGGPATGTGPGTLHEWFSVSGGQRILEAGRAPESGLVQARLMDGRLAHVACHSLGGAVQIVEVELAEASAAPPADLDAVLSGIAGSADTLEIAQACCSAVRELTGFQRVMVYRFDEDDHGEVFAEATEPGLNPYLGHHYPESDIPRQARALYLENWLRYVPDALYTPVPLVPPWRPDTRSPLDLSRAYLRSVSPVHLQYLANMGVRASMSVSLVVEGRLWGLISCIHGRPRSVSWAARRNCVTIGKVASLLLEARAATAYRRRLAGMAGVLNELEKVVAADHGKRLGALLQHSGTLLGLVGASGAAVVEGESIVCIGACPTHEEIGQIAAFVQEKAVDGVFSTRQLPMDLPVPQAVTSRACGVLAITVPLDRILLWFRPEIPHTVVWGGDPNKSARAEVEGGMLRIHPRRSFEQWKEEVRGQSLSWDAADRHLAGELRRRALAIHLAHEVEMHRAAVQARDDLVAVVSHDLRTPVSVVSMQATLLQRFMSEIPAEGSKRLLASAQTIQRAADRMAALLRDLLDLARIEAGRFELLAVPQPAGQLAHDASELMRSVAEPKGIALQVSAESACLVQADAERIFQVFANLIGNAIKFTPEGGLITVGVVETSEGCNFSVTDNGCGMTEEQQDHVFDRYWQATARRQQSGAGLGLYICRGIVEAHGGRIWVNSEPAKGSTFTFFLPRADHAPQR